MRRIVYILGLLALALFAGATWAVPATVSYQLPTTNIDGSPVSALSGVRVEWGGCTPFVKAGDKLVAAPGTSTQIDVPYGTCVRAIAVTTTGLESAPSAVVRLQAPPSAPGGVTVTVVVTIPGA